MLRYQHASDIRSDLQRLKRDMDLCQLGMVNSQNAATRRKRPTANSPSSLASDTRHGIDKLLQLLARSPAFFPALFLIFLALFISALFLTLADDLNKRYPKNTIVQMNCLPTLRAQVALDLGDPRKAVIRMTYRQRPVVISSLLSSVDHEHYGAR